MAVFEIRHLSLVRSGNEVLHDISLTIEQGETLILIGPSGSGKSSLLRCLNRLEEPARGTVFLQGEDITAMPVIALRRRVGMVFQLPAMFPGTVADNIAYGPALRGETVAPERIADLLDRVMLAPELAERPATELSGGQAQRVAVARALANESDILLLDEPTSALDPMATRAVEDTLMRLRERFNLTLVWVSHAVEQARRVGDRALLLDHGRIVRVASVDEMLDPLNGDERALAFAKGVNVDGDGAPALAPARSEEA